jgi:hypothetical protein
MPETTKRTPAWAVQNSVILFAPVVLGLLPLVFRRIWFFPASDIAIPSYALLLIYYIAALNICLKRAGMKQGFWKLATKGTQKRVEFLFQGLGLLLFSFVGFLAFYLTGPVAVTAISGHPSKMEVTLLSIDRINASGRCGARIFFREVDAPFLNGLCIRESDTVGWNPGDKITLHGKLSRLGFLVTTQSLSHSPRPAYLKP